MIRPILLAAALLLAIAAPAGARTPHAVHHATAPKAAIPRDAHGRIARSGAAKDAFKHANPCPANGHASGSCPGYVIDHVKPLACGGADDPSNMQWQSAADGRAKDRVERKGC